MRHLILLAACILLMSAAGRLQAREGFEPRFQGVSPDYQLTLARIIYRRMRSSGYRTLSGGVATVVFTVERSGTVSASTIKMPSGSPYIDALALAAVRVGSTFPPFPPDLKADRLTATVPLRFHSGP
ncbi:energy transducer TonB [Methylobacterium sp. J-078]|uniref:energy transducer TonB family protein n=1 Tax=Methylobacterium sp. J-078 TaxID=2836657 RepID=UPI001FBAE618|nr:energy transducer TonB [Methylobacterium sp. J-078]MCJ2045551.1 energy transducer TonB [Methylobacterium sp. J-078]